MNHTDLTAVQMAQLVRERKISPVELVQAHLSEIDRLNPSLNAFVHLRAEQALREARAAEQKAFEGNHEPLLGVPISVKSCIDVAGISCEAGLRSRADYVAKSDATVVARVKAAGAIIIGTTNTAESLLAYNTENPLFGCTNNPWDLERTAGGSSGGESAAIASGMSVAGFGSDGGGSVRVPAHFTGICALKPTPGRLPGTGHYPECIGPWALMGVVGPMARSVEELRAIFDATQGTDDGDPMSAPVLETKPTRVRGARIGILQDNARVSPEVESALYQAANALEQEGAIVESVRFQRFDDAIEIWAMIFVRAAHELMRELDMSSYGATIRDFMEYAGTLPKLSSKDLLLGLLERDRIRAEYLRATGAYTALLSPPAECIAFRHDEGGWGPSHPANYMRTMRYAQIANVLGLPAAVVPVARSREGLPAGVQIIGRPYEERAVLDVAAALNQHFPYVAPPIAKNIYAAANSRASRSSSGQR